MSKQYITLSARTEYLFRSISGFKYKLFEAIGDLADNSVDAECSKIWITADKTEIIIADDGLGMDLETLTKAITPWATNEGKVRQGKRGVYGIGMKASAFSLGSKLEVHTKKQNSNFFCLKLSFEELISGTHNGQVAYTSDVTDLFNRYKLKSGTVIRITGINGKKTTPQAIEKLKNEVGLLFFKLIEKNKITILLNNEKVESINPLMPDVMKESNKNYKVVKNAGGFEGIGSPQNYAHDYLKKLILINRADSKKANIIIHAVHIGRASHWKLSLQKKYKYFLRKDPNPDAEAQTGLLRLDDQGIYIMRNDRLITLGGWHGIIRENTLHHQGIGCRVLLEYESEDDELIGVDHTKTKPELMQSLKDAIRDQYLGAVIKDSEFRFRQEGEVIQTNSQKKKASKEIEKKARASATWALKSVSADKARRSQDPEFDKPEREAESARLKIVAEKIEWLELVDKLPYNVLWSSGKNKEGQTLLQLAEDHPGYSIMYNELGRDKIRKNLNLFFYYLASFEVDVDQIIDDLKPKDKELLKSVFKEMRKYVSRQLSEAANED
jgi:hypothetical protein